MTKARIYHDHETQPLVVTAYIAERMLLRLGDLPQIDGILAAQRLRMLPEGQRPEQPTRATLHAADAPIRVAKWAVPSQEAAGPAEIWGYLVTEAQVVGQSHHGTVELRKTPDSVAMAALTGSPSVNLSSGATKAYDLRVPTLCCVALRWWLCGNRREIRRRYLRLDRDGRSRDVVSVGGKRGLGFGRVLRWTVERSDMSASWIVARRWMPAGFRAGRTAVRGVRPPYWHPSRQILCVEPVA